MMRVHPRAQRPFLIFSRVRVLGAVVLGVVHFVKLFRQRLHSLDVVRALIGDRAH